MSDAKLLSDSVLSASGDNLASCLALLKNTSLFELLKGKIHDWIGKTKGQFENQLKEDTERLCATPKADLIIQIYGELNKILEIEPHSYVAQRSFEDNAELIVAKCIEIMRRRSEGFSGKSLQAVVEFQVRSMFGVMSKEFAGLSADKQNELLQRIREFINGLPDEQRKKILKELGTDSTSDEVLKKAVTSGTLGAAFSGAVSLFGFSFYTGAVSLLAGMAGLIGLTLPFGVYTSLTSLIAVFSNPLFLLAFMGGGGAFLYFRSNKEIRERLIPMVVTQLVVCASVAGQSDDPFESSSAAVESWQAASATVRLRRAELADVQQELMKAICKRDGTDAEIANIKKKKTQSDNEIKKETDSLKVEVEKSVSRMVDGKWGAELVVPAGKFNELQHKIDGIRNRYLGSSIWEKAKNLVIQKKDEVVASLEKTGKLDELTRLLKQSWLEGMKLTDGEARRILEIIEQSVVSIDELDSEMTALKKRREDEQSEVDRLTSEKNSAFIAKTTAENVFWGLEKAA